MKKAVLITLTFLLPFLQQTIKAKDPVAKASFKVNGNCDMCKKRIESAAKISGVKTATWDEATHLLSVSFIPGKVTVDQIQQHISEAGYDTEKYKASEESYKQLPQCCQYERQP